MALWTLDRVEPSPLSPVSSRVLSLLAQALPGNHDISVTRWGRGMWSLKLAGKNTQLSASSPGPRVLTELSHVARKRESGADLVLCFLSTAGGLRSRSSSEMCGP